MKRCFACIIIIHRFLIEMQLGIKDLIRDKIKKKEFFTEGTYSTTTLEGFWLGGTVSKIAELTILPHQKRFGKCCDNKKF